MNCRTTSEGGEKKAIVTNRLHKKGRHLYLLTATMKIGEMEICTEAVYCREGEGGAKDGAGSCLPCEKGEADFLKKRGGHSKEPLREEGSRAILLPNLCTQKEITWLSPLGGGKRIEDSTRIQAWMWKKKRSRWVLLHWTAPGINALFFPT